MYTYTQAVWNLVSTLDDNYVSLLNKMKFPCPETDCYLTLFICMSTLLIFTNADPFIYCTHTQARIVTVMVNLKLIKLVIHFHMYFIIPLLTLLLLTKLQIEMIFEEKINFFDFTIKQQQRSFSANKKGAV